MQQFFKSNESSHIIDLRATKVFTSRILDVELIDTNALVHFVADLYACVLIQRYTQAYSLRVAR